MTRTLIVGASTFVAGIALVLACSDGPMGRPDAGRRADAADAGNFEPPITRDRIYRVVARRTAGDMDLVTNAAECEDNDVVIGGGCRYFNPQNPDSLGGALHVPLLMAQPYHRTDSAGTETQRFEWFECAYDQSDPMGGAPDYVVEATAICFDLVPLRPME